MFGSIGIIGSSYRQADVTITQVQKKEYEATADNTTHNIVLDSAPTAGNLIVVAMAFYGTIVTPPSGYSSAVSAEDFVDGAIYYKIAGGGESATISVTLNSAFPMCIHAFEYSGISGTPLDQTNSALNQGGTGTISSGSITTTQADELIIVAAACRPEVLNVGSWNNSFTLEFDSISTGAADIEVILSTATRIVSATSTYSSTGTCGASGIANDVGMIASFKKT